MENDYSGNHQYFDGGSDRYGNDLMHGARTNYTLNKEKSPADVAELFFLAEREGFEPPVPLGTVVFKTTVIDHSTISPVPDVLESGCKGTKKN